MLRTRKKVSRLQTKIRSWEELNNLLNDSLELASLAEDEGDISFVAELTGMSRDISRKVKNLELETLLTGEYDVRDAILALHSGAGGVEAMDWVEMLFRMYTRWAEMRGYKYEVLDILPGEEAGLKNVSIGVKGDYAYGFLRMEKGVHRLVRISPFDSNARRHTSFASVDVLPEIQEDTELDIKPEDLRIDTFRSSGAGGQHVNKTDSA